MSTAISLDRFVLVSPVKDEERFLETTIRAVLGQSIRPLRWVIVDDGSKDETPRIIQQYAVQYSWIQFIRIDRKGKRLPGPGVIGAFTEGYHHLKDLEYDFIVKLDCDLDLPQDYFEKLLTLFNKDEKLGIASGLCLEKRNGVWHPSSGPPYHAFGASKMVRTQCFKDMGGFVTSRGWDTVDEIRAQMAGWRTCHVRDLPLYHLKPEGSGMGFMYTHAMHGEIYYLTGGGAVFFLLKVVHRMLFGRPVLLGGIAMLYGFLKPLLCGTKRLVSIEEAEFYRRLLSSRILRVWGASSGKAR